jgi:hypothetical protein
MADTTSWGSDVPVSMPEPIDESEILVDFGTHVFTATGMKLYASASVRQEIVASAYVPVDGGDE